MNKPFADPSRRASSAPPSRRSFEAMAGEQDENKNQAFAEIIQSNLQTFMGQCWQWNEIPSFGSLVTIEAKNKTIFGIVYQIETGSMEPGRYPFPYQKTHEQLLAEQPQIFEFLKTTFSCISLGYADKGKIYYLTPPEPPLIHSFIAPSLPEQSRLFFAHNSYLNLLFGAANLVPSMDELLLALLKGKNTLNPLKNGSFLNDFIENYNLLIGNDYRRLKLFLERIEGLL
jgi:hypothetical protein